MKKDFASAFGALRRRPIHFSVAVLACSGLLASCSKTGEGTGDPGERIEITSQGAALTAVENTDKALKGIVDSGAFLAESVSLAETINALGGGGTSCETSSAPCSVGDATCVPQTTTECSTNEVTAEDLEEVRADLRTAADDLVKYLRDEVFVEANLVAEATTDTQVTYRLGANVLCSRGAEPEAPLATPGTPTPAEPSAPELDAECVANAEKANLRVRLTQPRPEDVDVTFIATDNDYEPLVLQLYADRLGAKVDLAEGLKTIEAMGEDVGSLDSLEGVLQLQLVKNAVLDYSLELSILEALSLSLHDDENDEDSTYSIGATSPTIQLRLDGNTKTVTARYNYGAIELLAPLRVLASLFDGGDSADDPGSNLLPSPDSPDTAPEPDPAPEKVYSGVVEMLVAGYTGTFSYTAETDEFRFNDMSLGQGTSTLKHNGNLLAAVDLNPQHGRGFDLVVRATSDANGGSSALVSIDPTIDLNVTVAFANIADQVDGIPEEWLDDQFRMWFEGANPTFAVSEDQVRMVSGSFHMSSRENAESNIDVAEGMCLRQVDDAPVVSPSEGTPLDDPEDNFFGLQVVSCE